MPSDYFLGSASGTLRFGENIFTNPDTNEDRKSVFLCGSGSVVKSSAYVTHVYPNCQPEAKLHIPQSFP